MAVDSDGTIARLAEILAGWNDTVDLPYSSCGDLKKSIWTSDRKQRYKAFIALEEADQTYYSQSGPLAVSYTSQS